MNRFRYILVALTALLLAATAQAQVSFHKLPAAPPTARKAPAKAESQTVTLTKAVLCYYDAMSYDSPDYYVVLTDDPDGAYDLSAGRFTGSDCSLLAIDFYADATLPISLPAGDYTSANTEAAGTYSSLYSVSATYDSDGKQQTYTAVTGTVSVTRDGDVYTITAQDKSGVSYTYTGELTFTDANASTHVYDQIADDVQTTFTGGLAYYYGNLYESQTGNIYINLYDCDFDSETGGMNADGVDLALCAFNRLFGDSKAAQVLPGTYTLARNFKRNTYYPGLEVDYMGTTVPFGTYVKQRTNGSYAYGYIAGGTFTITQNDDDTYDVSIDLVTDAGKTVKGEAHGITFTIIDASEDDKGAIISNLTDNVRLNLDYVQTAYISKNSYAFEGKQTNGCNVFTVDISRPSGKDMEGQDFDTLCDLMRFEFIADGAAELLPEGTYSVMDYDHLYTNMFEPGRMVQGYFYNGGELTGTRYYAFYGAPYGYVKYIAPAVEGTVTVAKAGDDKYRFVVDLVDDAGWSITGEWTGAVALNYTPDAITTVNASAASAAVSVFTVDGQRVASAASAAEADLSHLPKGIYIIKGKGTESFKLLKR